MNRKIRFIWDFRGPEALQIAKHHEIHLKEFIKKNEIKDFPITGVEASGDMHAIAFWVIDEDQIPVYRDVLKPHRATVHTEN